MQKFASEVLMTAFVALLEIIPAANGFASISCHRDRRHRSLVRLTMETIRVAIIIGITHSPRTIIHNGAASSFCRDRASSRRPRHFHGQPRSAKRVGNYFIILPLTLGNFCDKPGFGVQVKRGANTANRLYILCSPRASHGQKFGSQVA